jgi:hypothetical protein
VEGGSTVYRTKRRFVAPRGLLQVPHWNI